MILRAFKISELLKEGKSILRGKHVHYLDEYKSLLVQNILPSIND